MTAQQKELSRSHAAMHTIYTRLLQGFEQKDWTLESAAKEHDRLVAEMDKLGMQHESPIETGKEDTSSHTGLEIGTFSDSQLLHYHSNLHSLHTKLLQGIVNTGWTFDQLIVEHERAVLEMQGRGFEHDSPMEA